MLCLAAILELPYKYALFVLNPGYQLLTNATHTAERTSLLA